MAQRDLYPISEGQYRLIMIILFFRMLGSDKCAKKKLVPISKIIIYATMNRTNYFYLVLTLKNSVSSKKGFTDFF